MTWIKAFLIFGGLTYAGIGLPILINPSSILNVLTISASDTIGHSDLRGLYGGVNLLVGAFLIMSAFRPEWQPSAYWVLILINGGYLLGRTISWFSDGYPGRNVIVFMVFEIIFLSVSVWQLRQAN